MGWMHRLNRAYSSRTRKKTITILHSDLTASATSQALAFATLPAGARVIGRETRVVTAFSGGGAGSCVLNVGTAANPDLLMNDINIFTGAAAKNTGDNSADDPIGSHGGVIMLATVTADVNVVDLTAGEAEVDIYYDIPVADAA